MAQHMSLSKARWDLRRFAATAGRCRRRRKRSCDGWICGPHDSAAYLAEQQHLNPSGDLRHTFDLYANIRSCRSFPGIWALLPEMDALPCLETALLIRMGTSCALLPSNLDFPNFPCYTFCNQIDLKGWPPACAAFAEALTWH